MGKIGIGFPDLPDVEGSNIGRASLVDLSPAPLGAAFR